MTFDIDKAVADCEESLIKDIARLVKHNSVESEALEGMPFGKGPADALNEALKISEELGFETKNYDNYAGYAQMGEGDKLIGIIGHVDIVPVGDGWKYDPFTAQVHDDTLYGRGVTDDKGPTLAALYAMKIVKDMGVPITKRVRLLFGANEETGMRGVKHYKEIEGDFDYGFTPDASFPLIFGEKGTFGATFSADINNENAKVKIISVKGGYARNVVCDKCVAVLEKNDYCDELIKAFGEYAKDANLPFTYECDDTLVLTLTGVAAHASTPHLGVNAISHMMRFLSSSKLISSPFVSGYNNAIGLSYLGENCKLNLKDEYGELTFNVGIIDTTENRLNATIDVRYPLTITTDEFQKHCDDMVKVFTEFGLTVDSTKIGPSLYISPDSDLVKSLYDAYVTGTNDTENKPYTIGGGTYAKAFKNIVAFGPEMVGFDYNIHMTDEFIPLDHLRKAVKVYVHAILNLLAI